MNVKEELFKLNKKALKNDDVPISAIIVKNGIIVSRAYNMKNKKKNPFYHAEILAIMKACKRLKTYNLIDCVMYVTLKPCQMCEELINEARLKKVYYYTERTKKINNTIKYIKINDDNCFSKEITDFFKSKR